MTPELQETVVTEANLAPSVHNTQPTRWSFSERAITLYIDESRLLKVGDPSRQDAGVSCGAALEGTAIALSRHGAGIVSVEDLWETRGAGPRPELTIAAKLTLGEADIDPLAPFVDQRFTWRGIFDPVTDVVIKSFADWATDNETITLVGDRSDLAFIADLNDTLSLAVFRDRPYREELVSYMRFSKRHPQWSVDGLNLDAMQLSPIEGRVAGFALRHPIFEGIDALRLAKMMISEREKTLSASGIAFFSVQDGTSPIDTGRAFYRCWLNFTRIGVVAWPMAVLADDPEAARTCIARFDIPPGHKLINVFRLGVPSSHRRPVSARLPVSDLIIG